MLPCLLSALLLAQPPDLVPEISRLDNGLKVVIVEDHALPLVSVQLWYRVGSANDNIANPGLCHVTRTILEYRRDAASRLRAEGVRFESRTLRDACYFASVLPPDLLDRVLRMEAERMQCRSTNHPELDAALRAAACDCAPESRGAGSRPAPRLLLAAAFPDHPYQHPPGFVAETLERLSAEEVNEFLERWFVPGNATLLVIGDVQPPQVVELVRKHFGSLAWAEPPRRAGFPAPPPKPVRLPFLVTDRAGLELAWVIPRAGAFDNVAIDVLMHRLCNPVDGPLCRRLTDAGCLPPRWRRESWREAGLLLLSVESVGSAVRTTCEGGPRQIERIIREVFQEAERTPPSEIELNRARALAAREIRNRRSAFADRALSLATHELVAGDLLLTQWELPRVRQLVAGDLQQAAVELRTARTVYLPRAPLPKASADEPQEPSAQLVRPFKAEPHERPHGAPAPDLGAEHAATVTTHALDNGVRISVRVRPGLDPMEVRTLLRPGSRVAGAVMALMAVGSTQHSVNQLRDYVSYHGLDLFPLIEPSQCGLISRGPAARVAQMIELHAELVRHPNRSKAACRAAAEHGRHLRHSIRAAQQHGEHELYVPPGLVGWRIGSTPLIEADAVRNALDGLNAIRAVEIVVVGDVEPGIIRDAVRVLWDDWRPDDDASSRSP